MAADRLEGELKEPWGELAPLHLEDAESIPVVGRQFTIGRARDCGVVLAGNKFVSSHHCVLLKDNHGDVWLKDTSINGSVVDNESVKGCKVLMKTGSVIKVVSQRESSFNVSYRFSALQSQDGSVDLTVSYNSTDGVESLTEEEDTVPDEDSTGTRKRSPIEEPDELPVTKKSAMDGKEEVPFKPTLTSKDSIAETLTCAICQDILYNCVSLQPCMHTFCAGCYSEWRNCSSECPTCRKHVANVGTNHIVKNLVESYIKSHPEKKRSEEEMKELDAKNTVTGEGAVNRPTGRRTYYYVDEDDNEEEEEEEGEEGDSIVIMAPESRWVPPAGFTPALPALCRHCPGNLPSSGSSSTSSFVCPVSGGHILCQCCFRPMPDRREELPSPPTQSCEVCDKLFCHLYWPGCSGQTCRGCLNKFKDVQFPSSILERILIKNTYESSILKNYLQRQGKSVQDMLEHCLVKLDVGDYNCTDSSMTAVSSETAVCYKCAERNFRDLVFQYRSDIPSFQLPSAVISRPDCYYGKNCRTQHHNLEHARRYNHICQQTRYE